MCMHKRVIPHMHSTIFIMCLHKQVILTCTAHSHNDKAEQTDGAHCAANLARRFDLQMPDCGMVLKVGYQGPAVNLCRQVEDVGELADAEQLDQELGVVDVAVHCVHAGGNEVRLRRHGQRQRL